MAIFVAAVVAFKLARKCLKYIKALSDPLVYAHSHMPAPQGSNEKATQESPIFPADPLPVLSDVAPSMVCDVAATVAVTRRRPKTANYKARATYTPTHLKKVEADCVRKDWEQYELLKACRLKNSSCKWYEHAYNTATPQLLSPTAL